VNNGTGPSQSTLELWELIDEPINLEYTVLVPSDDILPYLLVNEIYIARVSCPFSLGQVDMTTDDLDAFLQAAPVVCAACDVHETALLNSS
jgi:hypothetical protein